MTFDEIKNLTLEDFEHRNDEVWTAIQSLTIEQIRELRNYGFKNENVNEDDEVLVGLHCILKDKVENYLKEKFISKLSDEEKVMFGFLFVDKYDAWDTLRRWNMVEGDL